MARNRLRHSYPKFAYATVRDPEDRRVPSDNEAAVREKMMDKTLADSYPASDPPSSLPDPSVDSLALETLGEELRDRVA